MGKTQELIQKRMKRNPEFTKAYKAEQKRLKTAVLVVELRERHNLTQRELAEKVGVPQSTIGRIENGSVSTSVQMLERIADAVDKELEIKFV